MIRKIFFKIFFCAFFLFLTTPSQAFAFRFAVYGDSRARKEDPALVNREVLGFINKYVHSLKPRPQFVLFVGDAMNQTWSLDYTQNNWPMWLKFMKRGLKTIPLYMSLGNTDLYGETGGTEFPLQRSFQQAFSFLPNNGPRHYKKLAYFFEHGKGKEKSLFVVLDSFGFFKNDGLTLNFDNAYSSEQINWFKKVTSQSSAAHKFVITHGPAFSVEGEPTHPSVKKVWKFMTKNDFDIFFCGHEHIFSRWLITKKIFPEASSAITQTIVGSAGAPLHTLADVVVNPHKAHIHAGYTFVIVDVKGNKVIQRGYRLVPKPCGGFSTQRIDKVIIEK
jgi:hypothetical protein